MTTDYIFYTKNESGNFRYHAEADNIPKRNEIINALKAKGEAFKILTIYPNGSTAYSAYGVYREENHN